MFELFVLFLINPLDDLLGLDPSLHILRKHLLHPLLLLFLVLLLLLPHLLSELPGSLNFIGVLNDRHDLPLLVCFIIEQVEVGCQV